MIYYDSHSTRTMLQVKGSLVPHALVSSGSIAVLAYVLKWAENEGHYAVPDGLVKDGSLYSGFSFTLAFMLVFRTSQSYNRFWDSATQINSMRSQWHEAASSLCKFVEISNASLEEVLVFKHTLVRLFSMLGATAMSALAVMEDENFGVVDISAFSHQDLDFLMEREDETHRPSVVYQWIQSLIMKNVKTGLLNVPAPILTRVFQQMEKGMVDYSQVLLIMTIPFPFPYTQICWILVRVNMVFAPFMMCRWTDSPLAAAIFTLISIMCIHTISLIATEIENPLGDDVNDLPCHQYHNEFNDHLVMLLQAGCVKPPVLQGTALMDADRLLEPDQVKGMSLDQYYAERPPKAANSVAIEAKDAPKAANPVAIEAKDDSSIVLNVTAQQPSNASEKTVWSSEEQCFRPNLASPKLQSTPNRSRLLTDISDESTRASLSMVPTASPGSDEPTALSTDVLKDVVSVLSEKMLQGQAELNSLLMRQATATEQLVCRILAADTTSVSSRHPNDQPGIMNGGQNAQMPVVGLLSLPPGRDVILNQCQCGAGNTLQKGALRIAPSEGQRLVEPSGKYLDGCRVFS